MVTILGNKVYCPVCKQDIITEDGNVVREWKNVDFDLSNGSYTTLTLCKYCFPNPDNFDDITKDFQDRVRNEMGRIGWTAEKKEDYINQMSDIKITGIR